MLYDYIIIGGGITGITMARLLQQSGVRHILVLEAEPEAGGLCRTRRIGDHVLDIGGGHFLCSKFPEVYRFIFAHLPQNEFVDCERVSKIDLGGHEIDYPLESNIWQLPAEICADYLISIVQNGEARGLPPPADFDGWIRWKLGNQVAERYMFPYNRKIWGVEPHEMDIDWLYKIPRLDVREIVMSCLTKQSDRSKMPSHSRFYYPRRGGFQRVFDALYNPVRDLVRLGEPVNLLEHTKDGLLVNGRLHARHVINTAPWHTLRESALFAPEDRSAIDQLRHNSLVVSLHEENYRTPTHWVYLPALDQPHHRSFYIHNFAPDSSPNGVYRETNANRWHGEADCLHHHINSHAYPIPTIGWAKAIARVLATAEQTGVYGLGRWGQWQYFNSDVCILEAMRLADRLGHTAWRSTLIPAMTKAPA